MKVWILFLFFSFAAQASEGFHICYFSLNNEKEFSEMDSFTKKLNKHSNISITVSEHLVEGDDPKESFQALVDSGTRCDGLVISGHHTGSFGGERAKGSLSVNFLETLSCDPRYSDWFSQVHALWLQGCRTMGVGKIESIEEEAQIYDPDYHTQRVGNVLDEDSLEQGFAELNMEFSATLDQDNPLSSRYLRVFPKAKTFGWTKTAPGKKARSELSIPYHIAHTAALMKNEEVENPLLLEFSEAQTKEYVESLLLLLGDLNEDKKKCEALTVDAWHIHGQKFGPARFSFNNPDLQGSEKLSSTSANALKDVKFKECALKNAETKEQKIQALKAITSSEFLIQHGFNVILGKLQGETDPEVKKAMQEGLQQNQLLLSFISKKLAAKQTGFLKKVDYYGFYKELTGKTLADVEKLIFEAALKQIDQKVADDNYAMLDYRQTILQTLARNNLLKEREIRSISQMRHIRPGDIHRLVDAIGESIDPIPGVDVLLEDFLKSSNLDKSLVGAIVGAIAEYRHPLPNRKRILEKILHLPQSDEEIFMNVALVVAESRDPIQDAGEFLKGIFASEKINSDSIRFLMNTPGGSENLGPNGGDFLKQVVLSEKSEGESVSNVLDYLESLDYREESSSPGIIDAEGLLEEIILSKKVDVSRISGRNINLKSIAPRAENFIKRLIQSDRGNSDSLVFAAEAISSYQGKMPEAQNLIQDIISSPKGDARSLAASARSIASSTETIPGAAKLLERILQSPKRDSDVLGEVGMAAIRTRQPIPELDQFLERIISSKEANGKTLASLGYAIRDAKSPIPKIEKILEKIILSQKSDDRTYSALEIALELYGHPLPQAKELKKMLESKKAKQSITK